jgi:hypothetical protein
VIARKLLVACACALNLAPAPAASAASGWTPTGSMAVGRSAGQAATLADGRVLVAGGFSGSGEVADSEVYDPATGAWTVVAPLLAGRHYASLTRLPDGRVLAAGGYTAGGVTAGAEIYDPATNAWTVTGAMAHPRNGHGATLLANGKVLVAGGQDGSRASVLQAELYDPATGTWAPAGTLTTGRENHLQERLADGRVLVAGGDHGTGPIVFTTTAELYDPVANAWSPTGSLATGRTQQASVRLADGRVLAAGGVNGSGFVTSAERYDPASGTWSAAGALGHGTNIQAAALLPDGRALVADVGGGSAADLFDPAAGAFSAAGSMSTTRALATVTGLADGRVLVAGGASGGGRLASAELWRGPTTRASADTDFGAVRQGATAERDVTVTNTGTLPLWVDGPVALGGADAGAFAIASDGCGSRRVAVGASCVVRVRFTASGAVGPRDRGGRAARAGHAARACCARDDDAAHAHAARRDTAGHPEAARHHVLQPPPVHPLQVAGALDPPRGRDAQRQADRVPLAEAPHDHRRPARQARRHLHAARRDPHEDRPHDQDHAQVPHLRGEVLVT